MNIDGRVGTVRHMFSLRTPSQTIANAAPWAIEFAEIRRYSDASPARTNESNSSTPVVFMIACLINCLSASTEACASSI